MPKCVHFHAQNVIELTLLPFPCLKLTSNLLNLGPNAHLVFLDVASLGKFRFGFDLPRIREVPCLTILVWLRVKIALSLIFVVLQPCLSHERPLPSLISDYIKNFHS